MRSSQPTRSVRIVSGTPTRQYSANPMWTPERRAASTTMRLATDPRIVRVPDRVEAMVQESPDREVPTVQFGEFLMERLRELDKVAFVRFASVYRDFKDVDPFMATLKGLLETTRE